MVDVSVGTIEVHVIAQTSAGWRVLVMRRAADTRCAGSWEVVHGRIDAGETPAAAAVREVREETGLTVLRLYNVRVQPFYLHRSDTVQLSVVFAAFADPSSPLDLGAEHAVGEWVDDEEAVARLFWPGDRQSLREALALLADGTAGVAEDVLRVL